MISIRSSLILARRTACSLSATDLGLSGEASHSVVKKLNYMSNVKIPRLYIIICYIHNSPVL